VELCTTWDSSSPWAVYETGPVTLVDDGDVVAQLLDPCASRSSSLKPTPTTRVDDLGVVLDGGFTILRPTKANHS